MNQATPAKDPVVVVGGGWSGIAAAVELTRKGVPVTLVESARQLGGRARCVRFGDLRVDNGQHLLIGAYHATLKLMEQVGVAAEEVLYRAPLSLPMRSRKSRRLQLRCVELPPPLHLLIGLLLSRGLSWKEQLAAMRLGRAIRNEMLTPYQDISAQAWLIGHRQPPRLITQLWEPLCLATLNTPLVEASARLFLHVLQGAFNGSTRDADLLIPRTDLGSSLPGPALDYVERNGGNVLLSRRVTGLQIEGDQIQGVALGHERIEARQVLLAVSPVITRRLLSPHPAAQAVVNKLQQLRYQPIATVYLRYPRTVSAAAPLTGLLGTTGQWLFDRAVAGQAGLMAVVISAEGPHTALSNEELGYTVARELAELHPHWPSPLETLVIREKRATFASTVGVDLIRPDQETPVHGLWLAGDYTETDLPATLEGAVRSGQHCATQILSERASVNP